jgi:PBP1b-binding outer membrane lipoprotein LpoB
MRSTLVLVLLAVLATACGKKQAPAAAKSPAPDVKTEDADKGGGMPDSEASPRKTDSDPCEGGEGEGDPKP